MFMQIIALLIVGINHPNIETLALNRVLRQYKQELIKSHYKGVLYYMKNDDLYNENEVIGDNEEIQIIGIEDYDESSCDATFNPILEVVKHETDMPSNRRFVSVNLYNYNCSTATLSLQITYIVYFKKVRGEYRFNYIKEVQI